jgi:superfamily I DNA/RNA helicase
MSVEESLLSAAPFVLIEAPAGCGKTHVACDYARTLASALPEGRRVLVLAHTNAAVEEFTSRTHDLKPRIRVSTFDSLSLGLIRPYALALGLQYPVRIGEGGTRVSPATLSLKAAEVLARCPSIADMLVQLYPTIILDEHQDASREQHAIAMRLREAGAKVRAFGDQMQRIFISEGEFPWNEIRGDADHVDALSHPHRWKSDLALGNWILQCRERLLAAEPIDMATAPAAVRRNTVRGPDLRYGAGQANDYAYQVRQLPAGTSALLTARKNHMVTLRRASSNAAHFYEGSRLEHVYETFDRLEANMGSPKIMADVLLDLLQSTCTGLTTSYRTRIEQSLMDDRLDFGRSHAVRPILDSLQCVYSSPTLEGVGRACRILLEHPPEFLKMEKPAALRILSSLVKPLADPYEQLQEAIGHYKTVSRRPNFAVSTVHRAKGFQFDHVLVSNVSETHFPDDDYGRRLFYVAISRCSRSLALLIPATGATRLLA